MHKKRITLHPKIVDLQKQLFWLYSLNVPYISESDHSKAYGFASGFSMSGRIFESSRFGGYSSRFFTYFILLTIWIMDSYLNSSMRQHHLVKESNESGDKMNHNDFYLLNGWERKHLAFEKVKVIVQVKVIVVHFIPAFITLLH